MKNSHKGFAIYLLVVIFGAFACNDAIVDSIIDDQNSVETSLQKDIGKIITNAKEAGKITLTGIIPKDKLNDSIIYVEDGTKAWDCKTRVEVSWEFRYFIPKAGKSLGIWPYSSRVGSNNNIDKLIDLVDKWGFQYFFHANAYGTDKHGFALDGGFEREKIVIGMTNVNYIGKVNDYKPAFAYYVDEPINHCWWENGDGYDYEVNDFSLIRNKINTSDANALFITGDYKLSPCLDLFVLFTDNIYYSGYSNHFAISLCECFGTSSDDQRPDWTEIKNRYGNKNNANWINAYKDRGSFVNLLSHANNLNQNLAWYYELDDTDIYSDYRIWTFGNSAWQTDYLRRYSQKVTRYYKCYDLDCATCESEEGTWVLYNTIYGEVREDLLP